MRTLTLFLPLLMLPLPSPAHAGNPDRWKAPMPDLPDLSVRFIERLPRYPGTKVAYRPIDEPGGNKGDGLPARVTNPKEQKWPRPGQSVTFVAHVKNAGSIPTPRFDWRWVLDGKDMPGEKGGGWDSPLAPGEERTYTLAWPWKRGRHHVAFEVNRDRKFEEITHKNNAVVDPTDALAFHFFVQPKVYDWFKTVKNGLDSYTWDDWAQFQVREMNREFRDEIHPATPDGITLRVRLDRVVILPDDYKDPGGTHAPEDNVTGGSDGVWGFTNDLLKKNTEGRNFYEANPQWLLGPEWPLHHELGHQLGQPDYYLLPVTKERNEAQPGVPYSPPGWFRDQMMFSGNHAHDRNIGKGEGTWDSGYRFWGEHAARAFNRDATTRRGFFGTFLADVPEINRFVFLDEKNEPIRNAEVALHAAISREYGNPRFDAKPDFTGRTDTDGAWTLPRSPWRVVLNWTSNGAVQFVLRTPDGQRRVGFLNITDFNLAYWRGHTEEAEYFLPTAPAPESQKPSP
ncbi:MAG: hypothetical protein KY468_11280 [Armatimonadetes bacterium]|nr:hypothetical protein [Armatimonadota bacterium]